MQPIKFNMQNMQNNMQTPTSICRIVDSLYFAYCAFICTAHFADDRDYSVVPRLLPVSHWHAESASQSGNSGTVSSTNL